MQNRNLEYYHDDVVMWVSIEVSRIFFCDLHLGQLSDKAKDFVQSCDICQRIPNFWHRILVSKVVTLVNEH